MVSKWKQYKRFNSISLDQHLIMLNLSPHISVAMPVYNGQKYLAEAVQSILNQTFGDFEFLIIDDGSTDESREILRAFAARDSRIKLIERNNQGFSNTINEIATLATGRWFARMDQDDIALPNRFERQIHWLTQESADICGAWIECFGSGPAEIRKHPIGDQEIKYGLLFGSVLAHPTVMMKTQLIQKLNYSPSWDRAEDYELWVRAALAGVKMTNVPEILLRYRIHPTQISSASNAQQKKLTQLVRRFYWKHSDLVCNINNDLVEELLKLYESFPSLINMDKVDALIFKILIQAPQESQLVILGFAEILYLKACQVDRSVSKRWKRICVTHNYRYTLRVRAMMFVSSKFRMLENPRILKLAKYIHSYLGK